MRYSYTKIKYNYHLSRCNEFIVTIFYLNRVVRGNVMLKQNESRTNYTLSATTSSSLYTSMVDFCKSESLFKNWPRKGRTKASCKRDLRDACGKKTRVEKDGRWGMPHRNSYPFREIWLETIALYSESMDSRNLGQRLEKVYSRKY